MHRGRAAAQWWHTASIMATLANVNRGKGQRPYHPKEFHPYFAKTAGGTRLTKETLSEFGDKLGVKPEKAEAARKRAEEQRRQIDEMTARHRLILENR